MFESKKKCFTPLEEGAATTVEEQSDIQSTVRQEIDWVTQKFAKAIDVAAYLAVQDCLKYGISTKVLAPPYNANPPGISDHKYCTQWLKDGNTHTDVGPNFPWTYFSQCVAKYAGTPAPTPTPAPPTDRQLLQEVWDQLRGPGGNGWPQLGGRTLVDAVAELLAALPKS